jgi:hypothetical protein
LKGLDFVFDDFEELDGLVKWLHVGQRLAIVVEGVCEFGLQTKNVLKPLFLIVDKSSKLSQLINLKIVEMRVIDLLDSHYMLAGVGPAVIKLGALVVDSDLSLCGDFVV